MKPSEIFEGENSSLKKTYDETTKTLEEILKEIQDNSTIHAILAGTLLNGIMLNSMGKTVDENSLNLAKKELYKVLKKTITQAFQAGKDSIREEILNKLPDKQDERKRDNIKGSWLDNPRIQRAIGFNSCLNQVKNIIKNV